MPTTTLNRPTTGVPAGIAAPPARTGPYTVADWVAFEEAKGRKHELRDGVFIEVPGASYEHNVIAGNVFGELFALLRESDCAVLGSEQKVYVDNTNGLYPDVSVVCGEPLVTPAEAVQNPVLIVEVLSPSTEAADRGDKFADYRTRPSLQHYVLINQYRPRVEHFAKGADGIWSLVGDHRSRDAALSLTVGGVALTLPLTAVYRRVSLAADPPPAVAE
jgi:Uma2 family endonuclease